MQLVNSISQITNNNASKFVRVKRLQDLQNSMSTTMAVSLSFRVRVVCRANSVHPHRAVSCTLLGLPGLPLYHGASSPAAPSEPGLHVPSTARHASRAGRSRWLATTAEASPSSTAPSVDPRIDRIVDDISGLTLLQAADLVSLLKASTGSPSWNTRVL